jgi:hypothetical protein
VDGVESCLQGSERAGFLNSAVERDEVGHAVGSGAAPSYVEKLEGAHSAPPGPAAARPRDDGLPLAAKGPRPSWARPRIGSEG